MFHASSRDHGRWGSCYATGQGKLCCPAKPWPFQNCSSWQNLSENRRVGFLLRIHGGIRLKQGTEEIELYTFLPVFFYRNQDCMCQSDLAPCREQLCTSLCRRQENYRWKLLIFHIPLVGLIVVVRQVILLSVSSCYGHLPCVWNWSLWGLGHCACGNTTAASEETSRWTESKVPVFIQDSWCSSAPDLPVRMGAYVHLWIDYKLILIKSFLGQGVTGSADLLAVRLMLLTSFFHRGLSQLNTRW